MPWSFLHTPGKCIFCFKHQACFFAPLESRHNRWNQKLWDAWLKGDGQTTFHVESCYQEHLRDFYFSNRLHILLHHPKTLALHSWKHHWANHIHYGSIHSFCYTILLRIVGNCSLMCNSMLVKIMFKSIWSVSFPLSVRSVPIFYCACFSMNAWKSLNVWNASDFVFKQ